LAFTWFVLFLGWCFVVLKVLKNYDTISKYFTTVSIILMVFPIYTLFGFYFQMIGKDLNVQEFLQDTWNEYGITTAEENLVAPESKPDIYYIILDSYARSDILDELYGYDNSSFDASLESRGFYVATRSRSNYARTAFSLSSSLNMISINAFPAYLTRGFTFDKNKLVLTASHDILHKNRFMDILRQQGYQIVSFDTGLELLNFPDADYYMIPPVVDESIYTTRHLFEIFLLDLLGGEFFGQAEGSENNGVSSMFEAHRERILYTFDNIDQFASMNGDFFVFVHLIAPHEPFVFGPNGEPNENSDVFTFEDISRSHNDYNLYIGEVKYLNILLLETIDQILSESDVPPIIILQSDHGSRLNPEDKQIDDVMDKVSFPILNTYYLPGVEAETVLYPSVSPVNTFRIILNSYFGTELDLLEDRSYDWNVDTDYEFVPVCEPPECY